MSPDLSLELVTSEEAKTSYHDKVKGKIPQLNLQEIISKGFDPENQYYMEDDELQDSL